MSIITAKTTKNIGDIAPADWNRIYPDSLRDHSFLKSVQDSGFEGFSYSYITLYKDGAVISAVPCFTMTYSFATTTKALPSILKIKALICGSPVGYSRINVLDKDKETAVKAVTNAMADMAKHERASILAFKDFPPSCDPMLGCLEKQGFSKVNGYPAVELDIDFKSFDEYMKRLSHSTRKDLKRKFRDAENLGRIDFEVVSNVRGLEDEVYGLYLQTFLKSNVQFEKIPKAFLQAVSENMPDNVRYFLWRIKGRLAAFDLCLVSNGTLSDEYVGMDYPVAYDYSLYFITFRDVISWCIKNNIRKYESGALTYEPKKRLDLRFVPLYTYVKHNNRFINPAFKVVSRLLGPENHDSVLKDMKKKGLF
ncbi:MAG: GNAT family N-acetyltransferase [Candidatus Omnitrophota bacterium]|nr:GNAT family N-acetyltransferase [Candidatus Omnitrophota bacterium]